MASFGLLGQSVVQLAEPVARNLGVGADKYGLLVSVYGSGAVLASFVTLGTSSRVPCSVMACLGVATCTAGVVVLGLAGTFTIALVGMGLIGLSIVLTLMATMTAVQDNVVEPFRGRVVSLVLMPSTAGVALGALLGGVIAEWVGIRATVTAAGALLLVFLAVAFALLDRFRGLDRSPSLVGAAGRDHS